MVLEANKQYHCVNKFVTDFLATIDDDAVKTALMDEWKRRGGPKLKTLLQRSSDTPHTKRIVSKYLYFCDDERPKIKAAHPEGIKIKDVTCELGRRWREFQANPDADRMAKYTELFEADKRRYDQARAAQKSTVGGDKKKKSPSAYINFCSEQRLTRPKVSLKELSEEWARVKADPVEMAKYVPIKA